MNTFLLSLIKYKLSPITLEEHDNVFIKVPTKLALKWNIIKGLAPEGELNESLRKPNHHIGKSYRL